jgi:hypothetical protein
VRSYPVRDIARGHRQIDQQMGSSEECCRLSAHLQAGVVNGFSHRSDVFGGISLGRVPEIRVLGGQPERAGSVRSRANQNGRTTWAWPTRPQFKVSYLIILTLEVDRAAAKKSVDNLQRLLEPAQAMVEWVAKGPILRFEPAGAEAKG